MRIKSIVPLSDAEVRRITMILSESPCAEEQIKSTFPGYVRMEDDTIYFGMHSYDYTYEIYPQGKNS